MWGEKQIGAVAGTAAKKTAATGITPGGLRPYIQPTNEQSPSDDEEALKAMRLPYPAAGSRL
jgi:hypothetical protein